MVIAHLSLNPPSAELGFFGTRPEVHSSALRYMKLLIVNPSTAKAGAPPANFASHIEDNEI